LSIYDIYTQVIESAPLPVFSVFLSEVGVYEKFSMNLTEEKPIYTSPDQPFTFEIPYNYTTSELGVNCQIYTPETNTWRNIQCTGEAQDTKLRIQSNQLGTYKLSVQEVTIDTLIESEDETESECDVSPAPFAILGVWLGLLALKLLVSTLLKYQGKFNQNTTIFTPANQAPTYDNQDRKIQLSAEDIKISIDIEQNHKGPILRRLFKQHILSYVFSSQSAYSGFFYMINMTGSMVLGYALLGAFVYSKGSIEDNDNSINDIAAEFYPIDIKYVFIVLALVIPATLPLRLLADKDNYALKVLAQVFNLTITLGSVLGVILMGIYFCQGAALRWTLAYLIFIPLELLISEVIIASVLVLANSNN